MAVNPKKILTGALRNGKSLLATAGFNTVGELLRDVVKLKQQLNELKVELERLRNDHTLEEKRLEAEREVRLEAISAARWALEEGVRRNRRRLCRDALAALEKLGDS